MKITAIMVGAAALAWAAPAAGQERGTLEFGAFGSAATFDRDLSLKTGFGAGGRFGGYLDPRWVIEFEDAEMRASRPNGLRDVNVGILSGRIVHIPMKSGALSLLVGVGAGVSTETNFLHTYGVDALVGAKIALSENLAFRIDGVYDWLANEDWKTYKSVRAGLSVYRRPSREVRTVTVNAPAPAPVMVTRDDSVSAEETRRLRARDAALRTLRDSLNNAPRSSGPTATRETVETMEAAIHFAFDKAELTDSARRILDEKIRIFRANPTMTIIMVGHTDDRGTDAYNMALGTRRAEAAQAYIVSQGIEASRVVLETKGERQPATNAGGMDGQAANRRAAFRLLMTPNAIRRP